MTVVVKPPLGGLVGWWVGGLVGWVFKFQKRSSEAHQLVETILADDRCASFATGFLAFLSHPTLTLRNEGRGDTTANL